MNISLGFFFLVLVSVILAPPSSIVLLRQVLLFNHYSLFICMISSECRLGFFPKGQLLSV